jgi:CheY-like chemotaxis protein
MARTKILLVDDDEILRLFLRTLLEAEGFHITDASNVPEALRLISSEKYDVLLSDLHMPGAGDGLTVISAMRHMNPDAVTLLLSGFPEMDVAAQTILGQADEILLKTDLKKVAESIKRRLTDGAPRHQPKIESVASILERSAPSCINDWLLEVETDRMLSIVKLTPDERCGHLPQLLCDLVNRLRAGLPIGSKGPLSAPASAHGSLRRRQGYSAAMMVEESRILQVCIFRTLQNCLDSIDFSVLLLQVMTIADEVDSQLRQATECFTAESLVDFQPYCATSHGLNGTTPGSVPKNGDWT